MTEDIITDTVDNVTVGEIVAELGNVISDKDSFDRPIGITGNQISANIMVP